LINAEINPYAIENREKRLFLH